LKENDQRHRQEIFWGILGSIVLWVSLAILYPEPRQRENRVVPPGFGWSWDFDYQTATGEFDADREPPSRQAFTSDQDPMIAIIHQPLFIDGLQIIYRGSTKTSHFRLDVINPVLDPYHVYRRELSVSQARSGFAIFDQRFVLHHIGPSALVLRRDTQNHGNVGRN
jgi:hypothetical protein